MKTPGITVRPIITLGGEHEVNEVWLEDVRVPVENRVFEENKGWTCAKFLLAHERTGIAGVARSKRGVERRQDDRQRRAGRWRTPLIANPFFKRKVAELEIDLTRWNSPSCARSPAKRGQGPGAGIEPAQDQGHRNPAAPDRTGAGRVGHYGAPYFRGFGDGRQRAPDRAGLRGTSRRADLFQRPARPSIYGGSNEIQRNIIAKMVLGL
jgi:alkylation response protein AidB-like acyl-CoA dehydrogenase